MFLGLKFSKKEWIWAGAVIATVTFLTCLPYLYGFLADKPNLHFLNVSYFNDGDVPTFFAWIQQGLQGKFLLKQLYSPETQPYIYVHPIFSAAGFIGELFRASVISTYAGLRILTTVFFLFTGYLLISYFFTEIKQRLFALGILGLGAGLGWFFGFPSADLYQIEFNNFVAMYGTVLNPLGMSLMILAILLFLQRSLLKPKIFLIVFAILGNLLILIHPYDFLPLITILGAYGIFLAISKKDFTYLGLLLYGILLSFPAIVWQAAVIFENTPIAVWAFFQTGVSATKPVYYLAGIGISLIFAFVAGILIVVEKKEKYYLLIFWLLISLALLFNPVSDRFQRKFSIGITIPLAILTTFALFEFVHDFRIRDRTVFSKRVLLAIVFAILILSNVYIMTLSYLYTVSSKGRPLYISSEEQAGLDWIKSNVPDQSKILSSPELGNLIPALTGKTVVVALIDQTTFYQEKYQIAYEVLLSKPNFSDPLLTYVKVNSIDYIVVSSEINYYHPFDVSQRSYLRAVFRNDSIQIYAVN
jgi:hypothetical protein